MIKLIIKGGLGNQMFQYAACYSLAKKLNKKLVIDLSFINNKIPVSGFTYRSYQLDDFFGVNNKTTTFLKNGLLDKYFSYPFEKVLFKLKLLESYQEKDSYAFDSEFFNQKRDTYIEGYFNNYKYFDDYSSDIKKIFDIDKLYDDKFKNMEKEIKSRESVSIHIRRGDYLNKKHKDVYVYLDQDYYNKAIEKIREKVKNPHFYIFSYDDPNWFKGKLNFKEGEYTLVPKSYVGKKFRTYFRLMTLCKHSIISNSTFAFWTAYLSKSKGERVVSPSKWIYSSPRFEAPKHWILL